MIRSLFLSVIALTFFACGKSDSKKNESDASRDLLLANVKPFSLEGIYAQTDNGIARMEISELNIVTASTLAIPAPAGDGTRLTPRFPQQLVFNESEGYFATLGTYNDGTSIFKNVELRIRPYQANTMLDVTLVIPPSITLPASCKAEKSDFITVTDHGKGGKNPGQSGNNECKEPGQSFTSPGQSHNSGTCCPKQLFYVYRFQKI